MEKPLISVALTTCNGGAFLEKQLDSIYAQTYNRLEVVACDDCSSDDTVGILKEYERKHGLRVFFNESRLGFVKNFQKAVSLCTGDYIALSDQDDLWAPKKLARLLVLIGDNLLIFSDYSLIREDGSSIAPSAFRHYRVDPSRALDARFMSFRNYVTGCTVLLRADLAKKAIPFSPVVPHDYWLAMVALDEGRVTYCSEALVSYRQHSGNQIGVKTVTIPGTISRIKGSENEFQRRYAVQRALLESGKFSLRLSRELERSTLVYAVLSNNRSGRLRKLFYLARYFKYLSGKPFSDWVRLRLDAL